jgi:hypothetical protein
VKEDCMNNNYSGENTPFETFDRAYVTDQIIEENKRNVGFAVAAIIFGGLNVLVFGRGEGNPNSLHAQAKAEKKAKEKSSGDTK